jgi:endo-1,3(4)-beta-glucanase
MSEDFGNGWYNDHLFHYGYVLYASAILGRLNSTFVDEYGTHVDSILYDVAHGGNSNSDDRGEAFFPFTRHKSWFDGHSFASGLFPFADGKSQESTSEAVNCYYGAYLWSSIRWNISGGQDRINFAKLLLAMEIRGAKTYWHMLPKVDIDGMDSIHSVPLYNDEFEEGLMVGNLGMMDVTATTWFGTKELYVHMINFMPVTAITKELFGIDYVSKEFYEIISPIYDQVPMPWRGYTVADKAFVDPNGAWNDATKLRSFELDSALSKSQVYYWISSMKNFNISAKSNMTQSNNSSDGSGNQTATYAFCENHKDCIADGLTGLCCPTSDGISLGCCN